jgi:hypothetical protein
MHPYGKRPALAAALQCTPVGSAAYSRPSILPAAHDLQHRPRHRDRRRRPGGARAAALAETSGGFVANESTEGTDSATLTLRIPSARHTTVVRDLEELGEVEHRSRMVADVTA